MISMGRLVSRVVRNMEKQNILYKQPSLFSAKSWAVSVAASCCTKSHCNTTRLFQGGRAIWDLEPCSHTVNCLKRQAAFLVFCQKLGCICSSILLHKKSLHFTPIFLALVVLEKNIPCFTRYGAPEKLQGLLKYLWKSV